jgi:hypothetical protein
MSSPATVIDAAPRPAGLAAGPTDQAAQIRHSRSCPARQIGGACEPWCRAFPCPAWCTGTHRSGNPVYHLAAHCPPGCAGHPNGDTEADFAHDGLPRGEYRGRSACQVLGGDSAAARSAQAG